jgi:hypothetical protein
MPYPDLDQARLDFKVAKQALRAVGMPAKLITSIETKALWTGGSSRGSPI